MSILTEGLKVGDYACRHGEEWDEVIFERKSIGDLFHSFSGENYEREKEKWARAKEWGKRLILAIEAPAYEVRKGHQYQKGGEWHEVRKSGIAMCRQIYTISRKYGIEVWWCDGRRDMAFRIQEYYLAWERIKA